MKKGDVVYPAGCSREFQLKNPMTIKHMKTTSTEITGDDGQKDTIEYEIASEDGVGWYPLGTLTLELYSGEGG